MDNVHAFQQHDDIMDEAYAWVLTFNSDTPASKDDIAALNEWVRRSPAHKKALTEAEDFWCESELLSQLAVPVHQSLRSRVSRWLAGFALPSPTAFAAVLLLGLGITLATGLLPFNHSVGNGIYTTAVGEQRILMLGDDSRVQLDTHSQVRVDYQAGVRQIHLLRGKAHFDVAKNPQRPFEVYAGDGLVRAVGTAFSVYLAISDVEVIVDEGRVDLARIDVAPQKKLPVTAEASTSKATIEQSIPAQALPNEAPQSGQVFLSLDRGQGARFNKVEQVLAQLDDKALAKELAWRNGVLVFVRDPLSEVVFEVSRYTTTTIDIVDPELRDLVMGGRFRVGELDALLEVLEIGFGVKVTYLKKDHVVLGHAPEQQ